MPRTWAETRDVVRVLSDTIMKLGNECSSRTWICLLILNMYSTQTSPIIAKSGACILCFWRGCKSNQVKLYLEENTCIFQYFLCFFRTHTFYLNSLRCLIYISYSKDNFRARHNMKPMKTMHRKTPDQMRIISPRMPTMISFDDVCDTVDVNEFNNINNDIDHEIFYILCVIN